MRKLLATALFFVASLTQAQTNLLIPIVWNYANYVGNPQTISRISITGLPPYPTVNGVTLVPDPITFTPSTNPGMTNGSVTTNVYAGTLLKVVYSGVGSSVCKTNYFPFYLTNRTGPFLASVYDVAAYQVFNQSLIGVYFTGTNFLGLANTNINTNNYIAGSGIMVTTNVNGTVSIASTGGGGGTPLLAGTNVIVVVVGGSNQVNVPTNAFDFAGAAALAQASAIAQAGVLSTNATNRIVAATNGLNTAITTYFQTDELWVQDYFHIWADLGEGAISSGEDDVRWLVGDNAGTGTLAFTGDPLQDSSIIFDNVNLQFAGFSSLPAAALSGTANYFNLPSGVLTNNDANSRTLLGGLNLKHIPSTSLVGSLGLDASGNVVSNAPPSGSGTAGTNINITSGVISVGSGVVTNNDVNARTFAGSIIFNGTAAINAGGVFKNLSPGTAAGVIEVDGAGNMIQNTPPPSSAGTNINITGGAISVSQNVITNAELPAFLTLGGITGTNDNTGKGWADTTGVNSGSKDRIGGPNNTNVTTFIANAAQSVGTVFKIQHQGAGANGNTNLVTVDVNGNIGVFGQFTGNGAGVSNVISTEGTINIESFGAVHDENTVYYCSATNASTEIYSTNSPWVAGDVGKVVEITKAGTGNTNLSANIVGFVSANHITIDTAVGGSTQTFAAQVFYGHDDTPAFISALSYMSNRNVSTLIVPSGRYFIDGHHLQMPNTESASPAFAQILLPVYTTNQINKTFCIKGIEASSPSLFWGPQGNGVLPTTNGAILVSARTPDAGTASTSFIMGLPFNVSNSLSGFGFSQINAEIDNLTFRMYNNPQSGALSLFGAALCNLNNLTFDIDLPQGNLTVPSNTKGGALIWPSLLNMANCVGHNILVIGYYRGTTISEHVTIDYLQTELCVQGIVTTAGGHNNWIGRYIAQGVQLPIHAATGPSYMGIGLYDFEHAVLTGGQTGFNTLSDIDDTSSLIHGMMNYAGASTSGAVNDLSVSGGTNFQRYSVSSNVWEGSAMTMSNGLKIASGTLSSPNGNIVTNNALFSVSNNVSTVVGTGWTNTTARRGTFYVHFGWSTTVGGGAGATLYITNSDGTVANHPWAVGGLTGLAESGTNYLCGQIGSNSSINLIAPAGTVTITSNNIDWQ